MHDVAGMAFSGQQEIRNHVQYDNMDLAKLVGYERLRWMHYSLSGVCFHHSIRALHPL